MCIIIFIYACVQGFPKYYIFVLQYTIDVYMCMHNAKNNKTTFKKTYIKLYGTKYQKIPREVLEDNKLQNLNARL